VYWRFVVLCRRGRKEGITFALARGPEDHDVLSKLKFCDMRINKEKVTEAFPVFLVTKHVDAASAKNIMTINIMRQYGMESGTRVI
jgi:hypothetical protein